MSLIGLQIRDAVFSVLSIMPGLITTTKVGVDSLQEEELPALSVALARDDGQVDGDFVGAPHFVNRAVIVMVVRDKATGRDAIAGQLDAWSEQIMTIILSLSNNDAAPTTGVPGPYADFAALFNPGNDSAVDGILSAVLTQPMAPLTGDQYFGDARIEMVFQYHKTWPPNVPDILTTVQVTIEPNDDAAAIVTPDGQLASMTITLPQV